MVDFKEEKLKFEATIKEKDAIIKDKDGVMLGMWKDFIGIQSSITCCKISFMSNISCQLFVLKCR